MRLTPGLFFITVLLLVTANLRAEESPVLLPPVPAQNAADEAAAPAKAVKPESEKDSSAKTESAAGESTTSTDAQPARTTVTPWIPEIIGDQTPIGTLLQLPSGQVDGSGLLYVPSARYFKISDNNSPRPESRTYFMFNYFYNLDDTVNRQTGGGIEHTRIHREIFGAEWATDEGNFSVGLRLPIDTYNASGHVRGLDGASTDIGDLSIIFKQVVWQNRETGSLVSAGLAVTPPTGPSPFAGSRDLAVFHNTCLQPFCGWIWSWERLYLQGFTAIDAPTDLNDVTLCYNSVAAGYFLYQNHFNNGLTAVIPTVEVHLSDPLNHRGILRSTDPAANPDMVAITSGLQFEYQDKSSMAIAFAVPVSGPRLYDFQILAQLRWRY